MNRADGRRQTADGRRQTADGRRQTADGRRQTAGQNFQHEKSSHCRPGLGRTESGLGQFFRLLLVAGLWLTLCGFGVGDQTPTEKARGLSFMDTDPIKGFIGGSLIIRKAKSERTLDTYYVYWGNNADQEIAELGRFYKTGGDIQRTLSSGITIPQGATRLIVKTGKNDYIMDDGINIPLVDLSEKSYPVHTARGLDVRQLVIDMGQVSGSVTIERSEDESDITRYYLYWADSPENPVSNIMYAPMEMLKPGENITFIFQAKIPLPSYATHLLVLTANDTGMMKNGISISLREPVPTQLPREIMFQDLYSESGIIGGDIGIFPPREPHNIRHYHIYLGIDANTRVTQNTFVASVPVNSSYFIHPTALPAGTTHLLVYPANRGGESSMHASVPLVDITPEVANSIQLGPFINC
ncbi:MAG: hypothetical protein HQM11_18600 [SAR324 cluster bacterium]|nr:hypothetical protein [SAR324 cluster bacterium]